MDGDAVEVVHPEGADEAGRVLRPGRMGSRGVGVEHGVIDDQLAVSLEEVAECLRPVLALEGVLLFDELPGQIAPLAAQLVAHPGELLLLRQVPLPCPEPLVVLHHLVGCHVILLLKLSRGRPPRTCSCSSPWIQSVLAPRYLGWAGGRSSPCRYFPST